MCRALGSSLWARGFARSASPLMEVSMNRLASAALASAFFAATGGMALAANAPAGASSAAPANAPRATSGSTASAGTTVPAARSEASDARMTHALNLLEAKGYGDFHNFKQDGKDFAATVTRAGKQMTVKVDP